MNAADESSSREPSPELNLMDHLGPESLPHAATEWQVIETHISWVILTGIYAYKIKKPVQFEFVDYHKLEQRREFCRLELELNRRFCSELYLATVPIVSVGTELKIDPEGHGLDYSPDQVVEYAVRMQQFSQSEIVASHLVAGDQAVEDTRRLAAEFGADLAARHATLPPLASDRCEWYLSGVQHDSAENFHYFETQKTPGTPSRVRTPLAKSPSRVRTPLAPVGGEGSGVRGSAVEFDSSPKSFRTRFTQLQSWSNQHFSAIQQSLEHRARTGHVRQCHGDLHLQNIVLWQGRWAAFDGIEFNDRFQWIDVFSELAFTAMDLQAHGRADLGAVLLSEYLEAAGEYQDLAVLRFFLVYRAMVRAKIGHIKGVGSGTLTPQQLSLEAEAPGTCDTLPEFLALPEWQRYALVAERLAVGGQPKLIIMHGLSGSGKSTVAQHLVADYRGLRIRSDRVRQLLPNSADDAAHRYEVSARDHVYDTLAQIATDVLRAGFTAIIDATFLQRRHRQQFATVADRCGVPFFIASCTAPVAELERRILARTNDPSEATLAVLHQQLQEQEPLNKDELASAF